MVLVSAVIVFKTHKRVKKMEKKLKEVLKIVKEIKAEMVTKE